MNIVSYNFYGGCLGFILFESLKIYKKIWANKKLIPKDRVLLYFFSLLGIAILSGFVADYISVGSFGESVFIGFSVPNAIKTMIDPINKSEPNEYQAIEVDDIYLNDQNDSKKSRIYNNLKKWAEIIFIP
jgi:hypothetical protein